MNNHFFKLFFLCISIGYVFPSCAQFFEDIPLFSDEEIVDGAEKEPKKTLSIDGSASEKLTNPEAEKEKKQETTLPSEPQIGRNAAPRDKIILTPNPLPEVSIDLRDKPAPSPETVPPVQLPVNTRQEQINLPPPDKAGTALTNVVLANVHDVRQFDVEGFYLGMIPKSVIQMALAKGYKVMKIKKAIPLFQTTYYDTICRQSGIYAPEAIRACIRDHAHNNKQDYIEKIELEKKVTRESFQFLFSSPATGNEAYQITYRNKGDNSLSFTRPNVAKKLNRKEAFVNAVLNLYGNPDDSEKWIWGSMDDTYMQVGMSGSSYDAFIILKDVAISNEDYFAATEWKAETETPHHFGFAE